LLPKLFARVLAPQVVCDELANREAPAAVRAWIREPPAWLEVHANPDLRRNDLTTPKLDASERAAIELALAVNVGLVLMDDQDGVAAARRLGLTVTGTLGVLDLAARRGLINLGAAFDRLKATTFYYRQGLLDALLAQHKKRDSE
jgi:predicted nucleic acid-binding protein